MILAIKQLINVNINQSKYNYSFNQNYFQVIKMLLSSTSTLENKTIVKYHGLVNGESLIGSNIYKDLFSGVRDVVEGRTTAYAEELETARNEAIKTMETKAKELGANGIIGLKISYNNLGGTMGNTILVTVYGTAVTYK